MQCAAGHHFGSVTANDVDVGDCHCFGGCNYQLLAGLHSRGHGGLVRGMSREGRGTNGELSRQGGGGRRRVVPSGTGICQYYLPVSSSLSPPSLSLDFCQAKKLS